MSQRYRLTHLTRFIYGDSVSVCHNQLRLTPPRLPTQRVLGRKIDIDPRPQRIDNRTDPFGNRVTYFDLYQPHQQLSITLKAELEVDRQAPTLQTPTSSWESVRDSLPLDRSSDGLARYQFCFPSPLVPLCPAAFAWADEIFTPGRPLLEAAGALNSLLHQRFTYDPEATNIHTPLAEVFRLQRGVCQDLAHAGLAILRSQGLAARYVSGYLRTHRSANRPGLVGADASHAWISVWIPQLDWVDLDPTNNLLVADEHLTLALGRDYWDVPPVNGLYVGGRHQSLEVAVQVVPI
jgi:transglutaminase-like putative cysteine protease